MEFTGFMRGMGIGGWLTNYKRFNVLPQKWRLALSPGDFEHFRTYITKRDVDYIAELGMDHIRLGFDQIVLEEKCGVYREEVLGILDDFVQWCEEAGVRSENYRQPENDAFSAREWRPDVPTFLYGLASLL